MNEQEQRIALCEWMGWRDIEMRPHPLDGDSVLSGRFGIKDYVLALPDTNSLDVLHECEKMLILEQQEAYAHELSQLIPQNFNCGPGADDLDIMVHREFDLLHAAAAQRREALLKTLGLWKD